MNGVIRMKRQKIFQWPSEGQGELNTKVGGYDETQNKKKMYGQLLHATRGFPPSMDGGAYSMDGDPIHGSLHIPVDPVTRLVEEDPRVG